MVKKKIEELKRLFAMYAKENVCVAFSGGVDSSLVLFLAWEAAKETGKKVYAVTMDTLLHPKGDLETAKKELEGTGILHQVLTLDELALPGFSDNPVNRCYICKKALYEKMLEFAEQKGCPYLLEGSNEDDLHQYRPGLLAVKELGVKSPLAKCQVTKEEVRLLAQELGIPTADRPSAPCLATRLPYGSRIDRELLRRIEEGEEYLKGLGLKNVRIRVHGDILRLETDLSEGKRILENREEILKRLQRVGCTYVTWDLEGFRSGSMDLPHVELN